MQVIAPLQDVLSYSNLAITKRFATEYGFEQSEADIVFQDLLRWLWLNAVHTVELASGAADVPRWLGIRTEQMVIDEMWHTFLLYTDEYRAFCHTHFGFFIGHSPNDNASDRLSEMELENHLMSYLTYVEKHLGNATVFRWFGTYGERYSFENLCLRRIEVLQEKLRSHSLEARGHEP